MKLRKMMAGMGALGVLLLSGLATEAQDKLAPAAKVTYDNKYELYGGLSFMDFQAGQNLPKRMNLGGGELLGTYWLNHRVGVGLDLRANAGTTPVFPNPYNVNRPVVYMFQGLGGAQVRGPKNRYAAVNYHGYVGMAHGVFDSGLTYVPQESRPAVGLYTNRNAPVAALGASIDFNHSKKIAVRVSPDLILEHFGSETREFVGVSGGLIYRFGKR